MTEKSPELAQKSYLWFAALLIGIMVVLPFILIRRFDSGRSLYFAEREQFAETTTGSISRLYFYGDDRGTWRSYRVVYRYSANNIDHSTKIIVSEAIYRKLAEGSPVRVTYSRSNPNLSRLTDYSSTSDYLTYMYALFALEGLCLIGLVLNRYNSSKQRELISD
jgi:hypothetical protein